MKSCADEIERRKSIKKNNDEDSNESSFDSHDGN